MEQLAIILFAIFVASLLNIVLKRFGMPTAIGYILTGIVTADFLHLNAENTKWLEYISEFGIVLLMFTIGLEFSFRELRAMKKEVFFYGMAQVFLSGTIFSALAAVIFDFDLESSIVIGFALALSSTAIVLKILDESGDIHASYGRKALGILLFQDMAVIPLLLMIDILTKNVPVGILITQTLLNVILFFSLLYLLGKYAIDRFLYYAIQSKSQEIFLLVVFFIILLSASIAHILGFSYSLGAFFAGMLLAESRYKYQIEADLSPFRDLFLGVFFFAVGDRIELNFVIEHFALIILLLFAVMILKASIIYLILSKEQRRTAFKTALALSQIGEFALAILLLAHGNNLLDSQTLQILSSVVILSMILTPFILKNLKKWADWLFKEPVKEFMPSSTGFSDHIIVCGYGPLGKDICEDLKSRGFKYVVIEHDLKLYEDGLANNEPIFFGNAAQRMVLENLGLKNACAVIITFHNLEKIRLVAQAVFDLAPHAHVAARVRDEKEAKVLEDLHIKNLVITTKTLAKEMIQQLFYCYL